MSMPFIWPDWNCGSPSSCKPISSKWVTSERIASLPEMEEDRLVEDLEDLLLRPGGEPGASLAMAFISWQMVRLVMTLVSDRCG